MAIYHQHVVCWMQRLQDVRLLHPAPAAAHRHRMRRQLPCCQALSEALAVRASEWLALDQEDTSRTLIQSLVDQENEHVLRQLLMQVVTQCMTASAMPRKRLQTGCLAAEPGVWNCWAEGQDGTWICQDEQCDGAADNTGPLQISPEAGAWQASCWGCRR